MLEGAAALSGGARALGRPVGLSTHGLARPGWMRVKFSGEQGSRERPPQRVSFARHFFESISKRIHESTDEDCESRLLGPMTDCRAVELFSPWSISQSVPWALFRSESRVRQAVALTCLGDVTVLCMDSVLQNI